MHKNIVVEQCTAGLLAVCVVLPGAHCCCVSEYDHLYYVMTLWGALTCLFQYFLNDFKGCVFIFGVCIV
jgi:hypothetical protein